jgi:hypothetical protein
MGIPPKYARLENERRFLVDPDSESRHCHDHDGRAAWPEVKAAIARVQAG